MTSSLPPRIRDPNGSREEPAELDDEAIVYGAERARKTAVEFGKEPGDLPLLEWGERPEFRADTVDRRPRIFVAREGADGWRIRYQIVHEVFLVVRAAGLPLDA